MKTFFKKISKFLFFFGFSLRKFINLKYLYKYFDHRRRWVSQGGLITKNYIILSDFNTAAGVSSGHYFHQDLLVANFIYLKGPARHIDIGSRIDGFVSHVASFREIEVIDLRPIENNSHPNIKFIKADMTNTIDIGKTDSLSCLHAIEHFGMGRYGDEIDVNGHIKGINNMINMLHDNGLFYISHPIALENEIHFNAHRIFNSKYLLSLDSVKKKLRLIRFDYVDDFGDLHLNVDINKKLKTLKYGCGIYTFVKL